MQKKPLLDYATCFPNEQIHTRSLQIDTVPNVELSDPRTTDTQSLLRMQMAKQAQLINCQTSTDQSKQKIIQRSQNGLYADTHKINESANAGMLPMASQNNFMIQQFPRCGSATNPVTHLGDINDFAAQQQMSMTQIDKWLRTQESPPPFVSKPDHVTNNTREENDILSFLSTIPQRKQQRVPEMDAVAMQPYLSQPNQMATNLQTKQREFTHCNHKTISNQSKTVHDRTFIPAALASADISNHERQTECNVYRIGYSQTQPDLLTVPCAGTKPSLGGSMDKEAKFYKLGRSFDRHRLCEPPVRLTPHQPDPRGIKDSQTCPCTSAPQRQTMSTGMNAKTKPEQLKEQITRYNVPFSKSSHQSTQQILEGGKNQSSYIVSNSWHKPPSSTPNIKGKEEDNTVSADSHITNSWNHDTDSSERDVPQNDRDGKRLEPVKNRSYLEKRRKNNQSARRCRESRHRKEQQVNKKLRDHLCYRAFYCYSLTQALTTINALYDLQSSVLQVHNSLSAGRNCSNAITEPQRAFHNEGHIPNTSVNEHGNFMM